MDGSHTPPPDKGEGEDENAPEINVGQVANTVMVNGDQVINVGGRLQWTKEADVDDLEEAERKLDLAIRLWSFRALVPLLLTFIVAVALAAGSVGLAKLAEPQLYLGAPRWYVPSFFIFTLAIFATILWSAASEPRRRYLLLDACAARQWAEVRVELAMRGHFRKSDQKVIAFMKRRHLSTRIGGLVGLLSRSKP